MDGAYWIVKNSYGCGLGDRGYIYMWKYVHPSVSRGPWLGDLVKTVSLSIFIDIHEKCPSLSLAVSWYFWFMWLILLKTWQVSIVIRVNYVSSSSGILGPFCYWDFCRAWGSCPPPPFPFSLCLH
jgi:hypothetical protein